MVAGRPRRPTVAVLTMTSWGPVYARVARWLGVGLSEIGVPADVVFVDRPSSGCLPAGSPGAGPACGRVQERTLGVGRARWCLPALTEYLATQRPVLTIATPGAIGALALIAGRISRLDVVPWLSTIPTLDRADISSSVRCGEAVSGLLHRGAYRVAAVSDGVRDALVSAFGRHQPRGGVVVLPDPVDAREVRGLSLPHAGRSGRLRLCAVGRLVSAKGFDVLVDAVSVARLGQRWELLIVGEGPMRSSLEHRISAHGLQHHVRLIGSVENPYPILASADISVSASRWEGFGVSVVEALALGVPQVATTCPGGVSGILGNGSYGVMVPPDDPVALADAISALAEDQDRRNALAAQGRQRAMAYAPQVVAAKLLELVREPE